MKYIALFLLTSCAAPLVVISADVCTKACEKTKPDGEGQGVCLPTPDGARCTCWYGEHMWYVQP